MIYLKQLFFVVLLLFCTDCKDTSKYAIQERTCSTGQLQFQKNQLITFSNLIISNHPVLEKITEHDPIEIDSIFKKKLDGYFSNFCNELFQDKVFERFAFIYWYNVRYNQYQCCIPGESEIIPSSFLDEDQFNSGNISNATLYLLLKQNNITKEVISNGFTQSSLVFSETIKTFKEDSLVINLVNKVNKEQNNAYKAYD